MLSDKLQRIRGCGDVGEGNPGVFFCWERLPRDVVLVTMADLAAVEDGVNSVGGGNRFGVKFERVWGSMRMKFGGVMIRFKKRNMENRVKTGEI